MIRSRFFALSIALIPAAILLLTPVPAFPHDVGITSVVRVFIDQLGERSYSLSITDSGVPPLGNSNILPSHCHRPTHKHGYSSERLSLAFDCEHTLTFDDVITLPWALGVVAVANWADGTSSSAYFSPDARTVSIRLGELSAATGSRFRLAQRYLTLGFEHIVFGTDHLLFVLGLLLLVGGVAQLVKTITAFTVAHSVTLAAAVLGLFPVNTGAVEASIALSIVLLGREIIVGRRGETHLVHRQPWLVAFIFGLLHGFGFAGALGHLGLRSHDIPIALLFFNVGVEFGQLAFLTIVLIAKRLIESARRTKNSTEWLEPALGYFLGAMATVWFFSRLPAVWAG